MLPTTPTRTVTRPNNRVVHSVCPQWSPIPCSTAQFAVSMSYDHTTVTIPHPIRTAKSSTVGPNQYFGGGPRGNLGCRRAGHFFSWPFAPLLFLSAAAAPKSGPFSVQYLHACTVSVLRSHHSDYTASHPNCEVKHCWAQSVLQWGTMRESWVS